MARVLLLVVLGGVIFLLVRALRRTSIKPPQPPPPAPGASGEVANMVACAHCGVHLPESEAIAGQGRHYCSEAHRRSDSPGPPRS